MNSGFSVFSAITSYLNYGIIYTASTRMLCLYNRVPTDQWICGTCHRYDYTPTTTNVTTIMTTTTTMIMTMITTAYDYDFDHILKFLKNFNYTDYDL